MAASLSDQITWEFTNQNGTQVIRYGHLNGRYFTQLIPGGFIDNTVNPPRPIDKAIYSAAEKLHPIFVKHNSSRGQ